jgi:hypothetical protein
VLCNPAIGPPARPARPPHPAAPTLETLLMPFIIWGSRGITSSLSAGDFHCPQCDEARGYDLKQVRPFFTLYFIPIFPVGAPTRYVECRRCGGTFKEGVLDYEPPSEGQRILSGLYREMRAGASVENVKEKLQGAGVPAEQAEEMALQMCEGKPAECVCGRRYLSGTKECARRGSKL